MTNTPEKQIPAIYHRRIGDVIVTALSDGTLERTHEMMNDVPEDEGRRHLDAAFRPTFMLSVRQGCAARIANTSNCFGRRLS